MVLDEFIQMFFSVAALQTEKREDTKSTTASRIKFWLETVLLPPANDQMPLVAGGLLKSVGTEAGIDEVLARGQNAGGSGVQLNSYLPDANDFTHSLLKSCHLRTLLKEHIPISGAQVREGAARRRAECEQGAGGAREFDRGGPYDDSRGGGWEV